MCICSSVELMEGITENKEGNSHEEKRPNKGEVIPKFAMLEFPKYDGLRLS